MHSIALLLINMIFVIISIVILVHYLEVLGTWVFKAKLFQNKYSILSKKINSINDKNKLRKFNYKEMLLNLRYSISNNLINNCRNSVKKYYISILNFIRKKIILMEPLSNIALKMVSNNSLSVKKGKSPKQTSLLRLFHTTLAHFLIVLVDSVNLIFLIFL